MTRRKRVVFALIAMTLATVVCAGLLVGVDIYLHGRYQKSAGYNVWGYRGPSVGKKKPGEYRVVMSGGSSAFGYGSNWDEAIPAQLERMLHASAGLPPVSIVNLGYNNEGAYSFKFTLEDYLWLDYDAAMLYEGYNDIMNDETQPNMQVFRHQSPVYRLTGYLPIFPIIFREKAASLLTGGGAGAAYDGTKTVFKPGMAARGAAAALNAVTGATDALDRQLERVTAAQPRTIAVDQTTGCQSPWQSYCQSVKAAVDFALAHGKRVLVIGQPHFPKDHTRYVRHLAQQHELAGMIERQYAGNTEVRYVDLGDVVDLSDVSKSFDGMHLTPPGNTLVATALVGPVSDMVARK
jgi:hypothetical protein